MKVEVADKFESYPESAKDLLLELRPLIFVIAQKQRLGEVEESFKWGELSYTVKSGSAVRFDWKPKHPEKYFVFS